MLQQITEKLEHKTCVGISISEGNTKKIIEWAENNGWVSYRAGGYSGEYPVIYLYNDWDYICANTSEDIFYKDTEILGSQPENGRGVEKKRGEFINYGNIPESSSFLLYLDRGSWIINSDSATYYNGPAIDYTNDYIYEKREIPSQIKKIVPALLEFPTTEGSVNINDLCKNTSLVTKVFKYLF